MRSLLFILALFPDSSGVQLISTASGGLSLPRVRCSGYSVMRIVYGEVRTGRVVVTAGSLQWILDILDHLLAA